MRFAMSSRSSTERLGDFLKAYVSLCFLGVSLVCLVFFGCCWVFVFVLLLRHLAFCSHLQSNKSINDRLSFERARHEPKKKIAVRVGAKKAVGHIVSKRWWPTVVGERKQLDQPRTW